MKNNILLTCFVLVLLWLAPACKKDGDNLVLQSSGFPAGSLKASAASVVLTQNNDNDTVERFSWQPVNYGQKPVVTYTLQLDLPSDTGGAGAWLKAKAFGAGNNVLNYGFTGKNLNNLLNSMGLTPGTASTIAVRIKSDVNQYNGAASSVASVYSNSVAVSVTPYGLNLWVPGDYQGWNPAAAPAFGPIAGLAGKYEGYVYMAARGTHYFKFTNAPDWNHTNYGDGGGGSFSTDGNAAGLSVPDSGYYELTADLNGNKWTATRTSWGIIGDATPGGWSNDTQMSYDPVSQTWTVTANMLKNGSFKFRANSAWSIDFGVDGGGNIAYADNPFFAYNGNLNNLSVAADGNYTITLDLHVPGKYTYSLKKN